MSEYNRRLKMNAKAVIMMSRWQPIMISLVYTSVIMLLSFVLLTASGYYEMMEETMAAAMAGNLNAQIQLPEMSALDYVVVLAVALVMRLVEAGFKISMLMLSRGKLARMRDLLSGFSMPLKVIVSSLISGIITGLASMLFVIPGIILSYSYRYAIEIMYDDPTVGPIEALRRSAAMTRGHKMDMFLLDISFIPWHIASTFVAAVFKVSMLDVWVQPYVQLSFAVNYNNLCGWQPSVEDNSADSYVVWAKVDGKTAHAPDMTGAAYPVQGEEAPLNEEPSAARQTAAQPEETRPPEPPVQEKPAPDIEYWKNRALQLQKEMQEKQEK